MRGFTKLVPLALGGGHGLTNLQALCKPCHAQKTRDQRRELLEARRWGASLEAQLHLAQAQLAAEREESAAMAGAAVALEPVEAVSPCSPPRPRSSPSKPTYVPLSEWDLQQVQQACLLYTSPSPRDRG